MLHSSSSLALRESIWNRGKLPAPWHPSFRVPMLSVRTVLAVPKAAPSLVEAATPAHLMDGFWLLRMGVIPFRSSNLIPQSLHRRNANIPATFLTSMKNSIELGKLRRSWLRSIRTHRSKLLRGSHQPQHWRLHVPMHTGWTTWRHAVATALTPRLKRLNITTDLVQVRKVVTGQQL